MRSTRPPTADILQRWQTGSKPTLTDHEQLLTNILNNVEEAKAFEITPATGLKQIEARSQLFLNVYPEVLQLTAELGLEDSQSLLNLWRLWLPLALDLMGEREKLKRPVVQGILGIQGTGKTTLAAVLKLILEKSDYLTVHFSLDDLYKSYIERQQLQQKDPRLIWRGPPGTHDIEIGTDLLDKLRQANRRKPVIVPRFDKSACGGAGDKTQPEMIGPVDIVIFEGWFVGARPVADESIFDRPPHPIITEADRTFARDMNQRLWDYVALWQRLDRLMVLNPIDYQLSQQWRKEAEQKMRAQGKSGMSDLEIETFVEYFWKALHPDLFITPLVHNPILTDLVVEIERDRSIGKITKP